MRIVDFICGNCEATNSTKFVDYWLKTEGHPCKECGTFKAKCQLYQTTLEMRAEKVGVEGFPRPTYTASPARQGNDI